MITTYMCIFFMEQVQDAVKMRQYGLAGTQDILEVSDDYFYKLAFIEEARKNRELTIVLKDEAIYEAGVKAFNECLIRKGS